MHESSRRRLRKQAAAGALFLLSIIAAACAGNQHRVASEAAATGMQTAPRPNTVAIVVRSDFSVDVERAEVSKARNDKIHWALEGGSGRLGIAPKEPEDQWSAALNVSCAGAECWGKIKSTARANTTHEY